MTQDIDRTNKSTFLLLAIFIIVSLLLCLIFPLEISIKISSSETSITWYKQSLELNPKEIETVRKYIQEENRRQTIRNLEKFGPINEETNVVVITCHEDFEYMSSFLGMVENVKGIENALLIFSQEFYDQNIIELISSIKFARVLQIFYPFSIQYFPMEFPGRDTNDCGKLKNKDGNLSEKSCRVAKWAQSKHHFWWLQLFVFEKIPMLANYELPITFLQADFYPTEDFFSVLKTLREKMVGNDCDGCNALSHGWRFSNLTPPDSDYSQAFITTWLPNQHLGISMNRTLWKKIKDCKHSFCNFNDHSTHRTLVHLSFHCLEKPVRVLVPKFSRVIHADCGPDTPKNCDRGIQYQIMGQKMKKHLFFPLNMSAEALEKTPGDWISKWIEIGFGGWEDDRDREMCLQMENILNEWRIKCPACNTNNSLD